MKIRMEALNGINFRQFEIEPLIENAKAQLEQSRHDILGTTFQGAILDCFRSALIRPGSHLMTTLDEFLFYNPIRCGVLKYNLYLSTRQSACAFENQHLAMTSMAHVYMAGRLAFPDDPVWPDMEYFLQNQEVDHLFFGGVPTSMKQSWTKLILAQGTSPTNFARNARQVSDIKYNTEKRRIISNTNILDHAIHKWNCGTDKPADVETSMNELMSTIHDRKTLKTAGQRVKMPPEIESAVWNRFQRGFKEAGECFTRST